METQKKLSQSITIVVVVTALILTVPLVAMQFTEEVKWGIADFLVMGALIFGTGVLYVLLTRSAPNIAYKSAFGLALLTTFVMIWANLAVGLIGSGPNAGNLLYIAVIFTGVIGTFLSQFKARGMQLAMYATAIALALHTVVVLLTNIHQYAGSSTTEIIGVNAFFALLYIISGSLFWYAGKEVSRSIV